MLSPPSKRDDLVRTALRLFCAHGVHGVGIDRILEEARVAKATLYKYFPSKDELVVAALEAMDNGAFEHFQSAAEASSTTPRERFLTLPDIAASTASNGCVFVLASQEFPATRDPVHRAAAAHKRRMRKLYSRLAEEAGAKDPRAAGLGTQLILDGLYSACAVGPKRNDSAVAEAKKLLGLLLP
ncbi:MAG: TetR/AcrR family transcriptional regulator [Planctomycetota bacterium]|nr:TetR/AcrR family transcriptional regulator [Planctomycetota bacterium]